MADKYADEISRTLRGLGCIVTSDPTSKYVEEPGRADLKVIRGGYGTTIEVKNGDGLPTINELCETHYYEKWNKVRRKWIEKKHAGTGFDLTQWRENQREWADEYCRSEPYSTEYWIALLLGVDDPHQKEVNLNKKTGLNWMPRRCWLIPYEAMVLLDLNIRKIQNRLPYRVGKNMRTELQEYRLDAVTLLADYELQWAKGGKWSIPENHIFNREFLALPPRPLIRDISVGLVNNIGNIAVPTI